MLLVEPQPVSEEAANAIRYWWNDDIHEGSTLDRILTGSKQWDVLWHGEMMRAATCCEMRLVGVALSLYQSERGDPSPFPSYAQLVEDTGFPDHSIMWAIPDLLFKGFLVVPLPLAPAPSPPALAAVVRRKAPIPKDVRWAVWERDNFTCQECGVRRNLSVDHIVPESLGGPMTLENLQTLCVPCNSSKGARLARRDPIPV